MSAASALADAGLALGATTFAIATFALVTGVFRGRGPWSRPEAV